MFLGQKMGSSRAAIHLFSITLIQSGSRWSILGSISEYVVCVSMDWDKSHLNTCRTAKWFKGIRYSPVSWWCHNTQIKQITQFLNFVVYSSPKRMVVIMQSQKTCCVICSNKCPLLWLWQCSSQTSQMYVWGGTIQCQHKCGSLIKDAIIKGAEGAKRCRKEAKLSTLHRTWALEMRCLSSPPFSPLLECLWIWRS